MSAVAITEALDTTWANRPSGRSAADLKLAPALSSVQPARATTAGWQLTDRGIAVAVITCLVVFLTGLVVMVGAFLAIPEQPLSAAYGAVASLSAQG